MTLLDGQRIVVTGAGSGIGAATARRLADEGATPGLIDVAADAVAEIAEELDAPHVVADVRDGGAMTDAVDRLARELDGVSGIFNNAGVGNLKRLDGYTDAEWHKLVDVNLTGTFNGTRAVVPHLVRNGGGAIVNMASVSGITPTRGESPYAAAKAGVIALTRSAALEYGPRAIRANCVSPGFIRTPLTEFAFGNPAWAAPIEQSTPLRRAGRPDDVADVVVFLFSDLARYVTGQNVVVDGGSVLLNAQVDPLLSELLGDDAG